jgi:4-carboxymuconolactone decarboxylase
MTAAPRIGPPRIAPVEPPYEPDVEARLAKWMPPGFDVEPLGLFRTLESHPELASRMRAMGAGLLGRSATVPAALREIVIQRTSALIGAEYEWGVHAVAFGRPLGLTDEQLHSTVHGAWTDDCWTADQSAAFRLSDELHEAGTLSDEAWEALRQRLDETQVLELIVTAGWYHLIGYVCNGARVQPEPWAPRFPG